MAGLVRSLSVWPIPCRQGSFGKVDGQLLHARWWLLSAILGVHTLLHFGQTKIWAEDDRDAARSFCHLRFSFAASCLSASNSQLAFLTDEASCLGLRPPAAMTDG